jgi:hypothetical protein
MLYFLLACATVRTEPPRTHSNLKSLPIKGRLIKGSDDQLPRIIKESLDENAPYSFTYSEIKSFDESQVPNLLSLFVLSPFHLFGLPLGTKKCMITATFKITDQEEIFKTYSIKSVASNFYGLYYGMQLMELEQMALDEVRSCMDEILSNDYEHLKSLKD